MYLDCSEIVKDPATGEDTHRHPGARHISTVECPLTFTAKTAGKCRGDKCAAWRPTYRAAKPDMQNYGLGHCGVGGLLS